MKKLLLLAVVAVTPLLLAAPAHADLALAAAKGCKILGRLHSHKVREPTRRRNRRHPARVREES